MKETLTANNRQLRWSWGAIMEVLLPTTTPKYLHYSPVVHPQNMVKAPINTKLHLAQPG